MTNMWAVLKKRSNQTFINPEQLKKGLHLKRTSSLAEADVAIYGIFDFQDIFEETAIQKCEKFSALESSKLKLCFLVIEID